MRGKDHLLDEEWMKLIYEAFRMGLSKEEVQEFFNGGSNKDQAN